MEANGAHLLDTLQRALSQDQSVLRPAEQQLKQWETQPGFYSALWNIFADHSMDINVRWLAVLYFKNGIERYWRRNAPNGISEEEKASLRQKFIENFNEPVVQIATQLAVLIAKVARLDCPRQWDTLVPALLDVIRHPEPLPQQRALLTLHHVTKALASKRLASDRRLFEELTSNIFGFIVSLWESHMTQLHQAVTSHNADQSALCLDHALLCIKVLRRLVVFGFKDPAQNPEVNNFLQLVFQRIDFFLKAKPELQNLSTSLLPKREKALTVLTKVLLDFQEYHIVAFGAFIKTALEMTIRYNFTDEGKDLMHERFAVNVFNVTRFIVRCEKYKAGRDGTVKAELAEAVRQKDEFFTQTTLCEMCRRLILNYFPLSRDDLELWDTDPEDFVGEEGGDSWKYSLRPCTENLYLSLMKDYREHLVPCVISLVRENQSAIDPSDLSAVLRKDAVYNAAGLASFDLYDDVDFDQWLTTGLLPELQHPHANYRIIRRRVVWLLGCWCGVKLSASLRPTLYATLLPLLAPQEDLVVRIEAALTLKSAVDDFEFSAEVFLPFLEPLFDALFQLLQHVSECETKMQVLHVMSFIIERMRVHVRPYSGALIRYLPALWRESADHNMLRCAILGTTDNLVMGLGVHSVSMYDFLLPVLQLSCDVTQEAHIYLCEDALELWLVTLLHAPEITDGLLRLFPNMPALLELGGEMLKTCLQIIETYIVLDSRLFLQTHGDMLVRSLTSLLTDLRHEGVVMVYKVVALALRAQPEAAEQFRSMLPQVVQDILSEKEYPLVVSTKLEVLSRVMMQTQPLFNALIQALAAQTNMQPAEMLCSILDAILSKMDCVIYPDRKKLICLALCSLWDSGQPGALDRFSGMLNVCVETLHDVIITSDDEPGDPSLVGTEKDLLGTSRDESCDSDPEEHTQHDLRMRTLAARDPLFTHVLRDVIFSQLSQLRAQLGEQVFAQLMDSADSEIVQQLNSFAPQPLPR